MTAGKPTIVVYPGAYHPAETVSEFVEVLHALGWDARAFSLSSIGDATKGMRDDEAAMRQEITSVLDEDKDVLLLAHSWAGFPCSAALAGLQKTTRAAAGHSRGVVGLIFVTAFIPAVGSCVYKEDRSSPDWMVENVRIHAACRNCCNEHVVRH